MTYCVDPFDARTREVLLYFINSTYNDGKTLEQQKQAIPEGYEIEVDAAFKELGLENIRAELRECRAYYSEIHNLWTAVHKPGLRIPGRSTPVKYGKSYLDFHCGDKEAVRKEFQKVLKSPSSWLEPYGKSMSDYLDHLKHPGVANVRQLRDDLQGLDAIWKGITNPPTIFLPNEDESIGGDDAVFDDEDEDMEEIPEVHTEATLLGYALHFAVSESLGRLRTIERELAAKQSEITPGGSLQHTAGFLQCMLPDGQNPEESAQEFKERVGGNLENCNFKQFMLRCAIVSELCPLSQHLTNIERDLKQSVIKSMKLGLVSNPEATIVFPE